MAGGDRAGLERRNHELSVLNAIARELNGSVNLGEALGYTLSRVAELLGLRELHERFCGMMMYRGGGNPLPGNAEAFEEAYRELLVYG